MKQAESIAERFSGISLDIVISSTLTRARQTAQKISDASGVSVEFSDLFVERILPASLSGKPYSDPAADMIWKDWEKSLVSADFRVEDSENYQDIILRSDKALEYILQRPERTLQLNQISRASKTAEAKSLKSVNPFCTMEKTIGQLKDSYS